MSDQTERLRALLDERGVEYDVDDTQVDGNGTMYRVTYVKEGYARTWVYEEPPDCDLLVSYDHDLGAEDAIAATLGTGTCHITDNGPWGYPYVCSACGASFYPDVNNGEFNYCPNCGAKVVDA